jgi:hypothetical protein
MGRLFIVAIIGTILGYFIVDTFLVEMSFIKYFGIELIITFMHELYNYAKRYEIINRIKYK